MSAMALMRPVEAPDVEPAAFKAAMRRLAAGVTVVTSRHGATVNGMTATAVCSVSAEPPLVLVVVNRSAASHDVISKGRCFGLSFLAESQSEIARYFAGAEAKTFDEIRHTVGTTGCPLIDEVAARLECVVETAYDQGSHTIFVGRVLGADAGQAAPLVYGDGAFHGLERL